MGCLELGKRPTGIQEKPSDRWTVPLCAGCHLNDQEAQHNVGEKAFWKRIGINPFFLAMQLYAQFESQQPQITTPLRKKKVALPGKRRVAFRAKNKVSRPIQSANRWPPRGSQKIPNRRKL